MIEREQSCPECEQGVDRRDFMRAAGVIAAGAVIAPNALKAQQATATVQTGAAARPARPAEELVRELWGNMSEEQRRGVQLPWNDQRRLGMHNSPIGRKIADAYTPAQRELNERIFKAICNGDEGFAKLSRGNSWDGSRSFENCGANIFGDPTTNQWAWVFTGHHLTVRCDGNSEPNAAFGGPMYYGHSPDGHSVRNAYNYQTRSVNAVFEALSAEQRRQAVVQGNPGEQAGSVRFREMGYPGLKAGDLTADQRRLVETVMRTILDPYRREDADEVMAILRQNGGLEAIHLAFYRDQNTTDNQHWHFWRLEGPGFVWNYRILPHVHCFVNIAQKA